MELLQNNITAFGFVGGAVPVFVLDAAQVYIFASRGWEPPGS